jgi:serine protease Do
MRASTSWAVVLLLFAAGVGGGIAVTSFGPRPAGPPMAQPARPPEALLNLQDSLAAVAEYTKPSVVHITTKYESFQTSRRFYEIPEGTGIGSGVIVSARDGTILTNHHVVKEAKEIFVMLNDGRVLRAGIVGADPETDVAVIRLSQPPTGLVEAKLGDSDKLRVGDFVLAVGSPFGLHHTVTFGIVSAKGRKARLVYYEDYIQTTADIHPGNSGGPLVNLYGQVVGINSAMVVDPADAKEGSKRSTGISFSIPINLVKWVMQQILQEGGVRRGFVGIGVGDFEEGSAREMGFQSMVHMLQELGLAEPRGALITQVYAGYPAEKANLVIGDVVTQMNGEAIRDSAELILRVGQTRPGETIRLRILRAGRTDTEVALSVAEKPRDRAYLRPSRR